MAREESNAADHEVMIEGFGAIVKMVILINILVIERRCTYSDPPKLSNGYCILGQIMRRLGIQFLDVVESGWQSDKFLDVTFWSK